MSGNRRKNVNTVNAAALARWIVLTAILAVIGLSYVYLTLQLHQYGDRKKALEDECHALATQTDDARGQITTLTSRQALQRRLKEGYISMMPIAEHNIVRLAAPPRPREDEVQPVANRRAGK